MQCLLTDTLRAYSELTASQYTPQEPITEPHNSQQHSVGTAVDTLAPPPWRGLPHVRFSPRYIRSARPLQHCTECTFTGAGMASSHLYEVTSQPGCSHT